MPVGALGASINEQAFENGLLMQPDVIAIDAGSTDSGPSYLARGACKYFHKSIESDLRIAVKGARKLGIPLFVGSCGTCGTDNMVDECAGTVEKILKEEGLSAKIAKVYSQQDIGGLKKKWETGLVRPLDGAPAADAETLDGCSNVVAVMGIEPILEAYKNGADIVLCGRMTDTAIIAALPVYMGCSEAAAWHGAKTVECGAQCTDNPSGRGVFLTVDENGFKVTPLLPGSRCTPYTVSAHLLYENSDPFQMTEPSGTMLTDKCVYTQVDEQSVYVTGSGFRHSGQYTMKLEGAGIAGYQNVSIVGIADPDVTAAPEKWTATVARNAAERLEKGGIPQEAYSFNFKLYGYNAVIPLREGEEAFIPREIGVVLTVTAQTQETANQIAKAFNPLLLHAPADTSRQMPSFAFPFSPADCPRGAVYEFKLYHVIAANNPLELVRFEYTNVG
jgi:hypothetical protein